MGNYINALRSLVYNYATYPKGKLSTVYDPFYQYGYTVVIQVIDQRLSVILDLFR